MREIRPPPPVIQKFYLYKATLSQGFIVPILTEYVLWRGLNYAELGILGGVFMVTWVAMEVPTGYAGDRFGRKRLLIFSSALLTLVVFSMAWIGSFGAFVLAYAGLAIGVSFRSGVGSAWLYSLLEERLDADDYARVTGQGTAVVLTVGAVAAIAGAWLASIDWRYPFMVNTVLLSLGVAVLLTLPANRRFDGHEASDQTETLSPRETLAGIRHVVVHSPLRWFILFMALFFAFTQLMTHFTQPVSSEVGVSIHQLGWLYAGFNLVSAAAATMAGQIKKIIGIEVFLVAAPFMVGLAFASIAVVPVLAIPAFFLAQAVRRLTNPLKEQYINDRIGSKDRATILSAASMVGGVAAGASRILGGTVADAVGPVLMLALFAVGLVALSLAILGVGSPFGTAAESLRSPSAEAGD